MKNFKKLLSFHTITCILVWCIILSGYTNTIDTSLPAGTDDPSEADDNMRRIQAGFQEILAVEHEVSLTGTVITGDGTHGDITSTSITNVGLLAQAGSAEFAGTVSVGETLDVTGNTAITGTFDVTGNIDPTSYVGDNGGFIDDDAMGATATATAVASAESIKAYVDARADGYILVQDVQAQNAAGASVTTGDWRKVRVSTEVTDTGSNCSLGSDVVTLGTGTYECHIIVPIQTTGITSSRLYDTTGSAVLINGMNGAAQAGETVYYQPFTHIIGRFTITEASALEIQVNVSTNGTLGAPNNLASTSEYYTTAEFRKIN